MLSAKKKSMKVRCVKCNKNMEKVVLDSYEYTEGLPLFDVPAFKCPKCGNIFLTEKTIDELEKRTKLLKMKMFGFERKITVSGRGLVVRIPSELIPYLHLKAGKKVTIIPTNREGFFVKKE